jgi:hypothetical protein
MYLGGGVVGIVAVVPIVLFLVSYLIYTQAPKHRHGKSDIRAASDARAKVVPESRRQRANAVVGPNRYAIGPPRDSSRALAPQP